MQKTLVIAAVFAAGKGHVKNGIFAFDVVITLLKLIVTIIERKMKTRINDLRENMLY